MDLLEQLEPLVLEYLDRRDAPVLRVSLVPLVKLDFLEHQEALAQQETPDRLVNPDRKDQIFSF